MSSVLDEVLCGMEAAVAASAPRLLERRVGAKKRFVELAAASLGSERTTYQVVDPLSLLDPEDICNKNDHNAEEQRKSKDDEPGKTEPREVSNKADGRSVEVDYYQNMLHQCEEDDKKNKMEAANSLESIRELRRVYMFGLIKISKLQDLREAPDAIMPGNFVERKMTEQEDIDEKQGAVSK